MKILALESSAKAASAALGEGGNIIAQYYQNSGLTHSRTLMPLVEDLLKNCALTLDDVGCIAVAVGPGSFTGLRIGISAAMGMALGAGIPCCGVSTLEAMAGQLGHCDGLICPVMDARRGQVYNALFESENGALNRLGEDRALSLDELRESLEKSKKSIFLVGDGAALCYNFMDRHGVKAVMPPPHLEFQSAAGVLLAAERQMEAGKMPQGQQLTPNYIRLSQAERERLERSGG